MRKTFADNTAKVFYFHAAKVIYAHIYCTHCKKVPTAG